MIERIAAFYDLSVVRTRSLMRAAMFYFVFVGGVTTFKSATNALYLARRDPTDLPYLYLATAIVIAVTTILVGKQLSTQSAKPVLRSAVVISFVVVGTLTLLAVADFRPSLAALYVAGEVYATTLSVLFWARLSEVFDVRTGKRTFGAVAAAGMAGAVLGGLGVRAFASYLPAVTWCAFTTFTMLIVWFLLGRGKGIRAIVRPKISFRQGLAYAAVDRFPRGVALLVLLLAVQTATVDYVFRTGAVTFERGDEAAMAGLFGVLNAVVGVGSILFQMAFTALLLRRIGVFAFLSIIPLLSIAAAGWSLGMPTIFLPIFLLKALEMMGSLSICQPALQLLYNPMPTGIRDSVRALIDGAIKKLGGAVGGVLLILFGSLLEHRQLIGLVIGLALALMLWIRFLRKGYRRALEAKIGAPAGPSKPTVNLHDRATLNTLLEALKDEDGGKVLAALSVLPKEQSAAHIPILISHSDEAVRLEAIRLIAESPDPTYAEMLEYVIQTDNRRPAARAAEALANSDFERARRVLEPIMTAPHGTYDMGLVCSAIKVLLPGSKRPQAEGVEAKESESLAEKALEELFDRGHRGYPAERREVARLLGHLGPSRYAPQLSLYLDDPESSVRILAVKSAGLAHDKSLPKKMVPLLLDRTTRRAVRQALSAYGDEVVTLLGLTLDDRRQEVALRVQVPKILRLIGTEKSAQAMLFSNVHDDAFLRYVIVQELSRMRREVKGLQFDQKRTEEAAMRRFRAYNYYRPIAADLAASMEFSLLRRAVEDRVRQNLRAALRVLGLSYDMKTMENAYRGLMRGNYADAVELVDVALEGSDIRGQVLKHLEHAEPSMSPARAMERAMTLVEGRDIQIAMVAWESLRRLGQDPPDVHEPSLGEPLMPKSIVDRLFVLERVQLFHGLSVDDLAAVAALVTEAHADPREVIYRQDEEGTNMHILVSGEVHLLRDGKPLMDLYSGDSFGQVSILDRGPRPVTAQAGTEGAECLVLEREPFMDLISDRPQVVRGLFVVLARRLRELLDLTGAKPSQARSAPPRV